MALKRVMYLRNVFAAKAVDEQHFLPTLTYKVLHLNLNLCDVDLCGYDDYK